MNLFQTRYEGMYGAYVPPPAPIIIEPKVQIPEQASFADKAGEVFFWVGVVALTGIAIYVVIKLSEDRDEENEEDEYDDEDIDDAKDGEKTKNEIIDNYVRKSLKR